MGNTNYVGTSQGASAVITATPQTARDMAASGIEFKDCKDKCDSDVTCNGFIFATSTKTCKFFNKTSTPYFNPDETTFLKKGTAYSNAAGYKNTDFNDVASQMVANPVKVAEAIAEAAARTAATNATVIAAANAAASRTETISKPTPENDNKLSTGAIVGISIGSVAGALLLFYLVWYFLIRK
jgi:hypothetical protein